MLYIKQLYFYYKIVKLSFESCLRGESISPRRFWRVLALEEFTDVQCVIVDHPMPSLAGYRIIEGSSPFKSASDFRLLPLLLGFSEISIDQCCARDSIQRSMMKDVIWFSSESYASRAGIIMEIGLSRHEELPSSIS